MHLFTASLFTDIRRPITKTIQSKEMSDKDNHSDAELLPRFGEEFSQMVSRVAEIWGRQWMWSSLKHPPAHRPSWLYNYAFWQCSLCCQWIMHLLNFLTSWLSKPDVTTPVDFIAQAQPIALSLRNQPTNQIPTQLNLTLDFECRIYILQKAHDSKDPKDFVSEV